MYSRRVKTGCCCFSTLNYQLVDAEKVEKVDKQTGEAVVDKKTGTPVMVDKVLATMKLVKPRKPKKKGACNKSFGALSCFCSPFNACCCGVCDMCCDGFRCIVGCPCKLFLCLNPPDILLLDQTVNNDDWAQPVKLVSGRLKSLPPKDTVFKIDDRKCVTYVPYVDTKPTTKKKAPYRSPGGTLFKVCVFYQQIEFQFYLPCHSATRCTLLCYKGSPSRRYLQKNLEASVS